MEENRVTIQGYSLNYLSFQNISAAKRLSDEFVGSGMYSEEVLRSILSRPNHFFCLLMDGNEPIGFFYCYVCTISEAASGLKLPKAAISEIAGINVENIGIFKSIGISPVYRSKGLAGDLIRYFERTLFDLFPITAILVPTWKQGDTVPAKNPLDREGFRYLCDTDDVWHDVTTLRCPVCGQKRCVCKAAIYYKKRGIPNG